MCDLCCPHHHRASYCAPRGRPWARPRPPPEYVRPYDDPPDYAAIPPARPRVPAPRFGQLRQRLDLAILAFAALSLLQILAVQLLAIRLARPGAA